MRHILILLLLIPVISFAQNKRYTGNVPITDTKLKVTGEFGIPKDSVTGLDSARLAYIDGTVFKETNVHSWVPVSQWNKEGNNTYELGPRFTLANAAGTRRWTNQLTATNGLVWGYYGGTSYATMMSIDASGNVGIPNQLRIGNNTPSYSLDIQKDFNNADGFRMLDQSGGYFSIQQSTSTVNTYQPMLIGLANGVASSMIFKILRSSTAASGAAGTKTARFLFRDFSDTQPIAASDILLTIENGVTTTHTILGDGTTMIGSTTDQGAFSLQNTGGLYQSGDVSLKGVRAASPGFRILTHGTNSDSSVSQITMQQLRDSVGGANLTGGAVKVNIQIVSDADYTVDADDYTILYSTMTADRTLTLPNPATNANRMIIIKHGGNGAFSINTSVSYRENATTTASSIAQGHSACLISDGTEWWLVWDANG